jgi:hypothetical protein
VRHRQEQATSSDPGFQVASQLKIKQVCPPQKK